MNDIKIKFTDNALMQAKLIIENDLKNREDRHFRLSVKSKGCDGFSYELGFDHIRENDLQFDFQNENESIRLIFDPMVEEFANQLEIDYIFDPYKNEEGFIVSEHKGDSFRGKFWLKKKP